jgi:hypothetical protein
MVGGHNGSEKGCERLLKDIDELDCQKGQSQCSLVLMNSLKSSTSSRIEEHN